MQVTLRLGRQFARQAGFAQHELHLPPGATAATLLEAAAVAAPGLECVAGGRVDLAVASLSVNGKGVDPRRPQVTELHDGDEAYLYGPVSGG